MLNEAAAATPATYGIKNIHGLLLPPFGVLFLLYREISFKQTYLPCRPKMSWPGADEKELAGSQTAA